MITNLKPAAPKMKCKSASMKDKSRSGEVRGAQVPIET